MFDEIKGAYLPETRFPERVVDREKCVKCGRCVEACPTMGFVADKEGYPVPIGYGGFAEACLNCWNCVAVCPSGAMSVEGAYEVPEGRYKTRLMADPRFPEPFPGDSRTIEELEPELTELERVLYKRRSNRLYKKKPVPREVLHRLIEAARFAPSAGNCQPVKFIVVTDREFITEIEGEAMKVLRRFKNLYLDPAGKRRAWRSAIFTTASLLMPTKMDPRPMTAMEKADKTDDVIYWGAPAVIFVCKNVRGISNPDLDTGIACQNLVLAAHSLGLGTCYVGLTIEPLNYPYMKKFRERLGVAHPFELVTSIAVGYPQGKIDAFVKRDTPQVSWIE